MKIEEAVLIAKAVTRAKLLAGRYMDVPYHQEQLIDALLAFYDIAGEHPVGRDEYISQQKRANALNARNQGYRKQLGLEKTSLDTESGDIPQ